MGLCEFEFACLNTVRALALPLIELDPRNVLPSAFLGTHSNPMCVGMYRTENIGSSSNNAGWARGGRTLVITEYDAPNRPGSVHHRTAIVPQPYATVRHRTPLRTRHRPQVTAQAPSRHLTKAHTPRHACSWSDIFSPWKGQTQPIKK
jgi:hypothetical protein